MKRLFITIPLILSSIILQAQIRVLSPEEMKSDFIQMRELLEEQHWDFYFYTPEEEMNSIFDKQFSMIRDSLPMNEFYKVLTPIISKIGNGHTAIWMPGSYWKSGNGKFFPYTIKIIEDKVIISGRYNKTATLPRGTIIRSINNQPIDEIVDEMIQNYSSEAMRIEGKMASVQRRFAMIYVRRFGFPDSYSMTYQLPGEEKTMSKIVSSATESEVRDLVFKSHNKARLDLKIMENGEIAVLTVNSFIYYDRVDFFKAFLDSSFTAIKEKEISKLLLDLRGNDGGDPFCSAPLFSYLEPEPLIYFKKASRGYSELTNNPIPLAKNYYSGKLIVFMDSRCFSTNSHFCSLIKYHNIGTIIGTPSSGNYICSNAKHIDLDNSKIMVYYGTRGYATAVEMDRTKPIMPDILVEETTETFLSGRDLYMEKALQRFKIACGELE